ncbi:ATP-dependent DNA ligase [Gracilimonas mengyeensis]|uniref:DNA ligase n=1 Tax=Gracilimonas mengyeensis TaxID=1302730 RepID=A0A521C462_9BACT|nr:ATP-dependent DNA ligase [Gracilimonas mengyeensis]SMO54266.1 DNA ligase-1 [Gracilimonas mengyeensis]
MPLSHTLSKPNTFRKLAETAQAIAETRGSNAKIARCSQYFSTLENDRDLDLAACFLGEGAFSDVSGKRASVGSRTTSTLAADFCEIDYDLVFKPCKTATGSASETIEKLFTNIQEAKDKWSGRGLSLEEVKNIYDRLYEVSSRNDKQQILQESWEQMTPLEVKYFIRIMGRGSLRIGFESKSITSALAKAFDHPVKDIRHVHMLTGSIGKTAVMAKNNQLHEADFQLFQPVAFMLASPVESRSVEDFEAYVAEEKFDGMRCQLHAKGDEVKIFSRDLNDISGSFPEIIKEFAAKELPGTVLDGEICVYKEDTIQPFQLLQQRMGVKKPSKKIQKEYPVALISFDVLYHNEETLFAKPLTERRKLLNELSGEYQLPVTIQKAITAEEDVDVLFKQALEHGNEGLMLKHKHSAYEYGQRKKSWLKVKQPGGSLDTIMMYAHAGSGKRGGTYSDFTLGVSVREDERYEEEFIPIGKAYGGYTDDELKKLNARIKEITAEKYGPTLGLYPDIVIELEFDDIQVNKRTKANYTLRFPRFKAIRWDLSPDDVDTLKDVERLFEEKLNQERLGQAQNPSFEVK